MKEGGTGLHKTIREINLVYKGLICRKWSREPSTFRAKSLRAGKNPHELYIVRMLNACTFGWCLLAKVCVKYVVPDKFFTF